MVFFAVVALMLPLGSVWGAQTVVIDDFSVTQGSSAAPAVQVCTPGPAVTDHVTGPAANMVGGNRIIEITHTGGDGPCTKAYVDGGAAPHSWVVVNDTGSTGWGRAIWSGGSGVNDYNLALDLSTLQYFNMTYVSTDHPTTFYLQVYSDATHGSEATITFANPGGGSVTNHHILPGDFSAISGLSAADFSSIKRIVLLFDEYLEIDTAVREIQAVIAEPGLTCLSKTFDITDLPGPDGTVTATVQIQNTGELDITDLVATDVMDDSARMTIVPGSSTIGDPTEGPAGTWTFPAQSLAAGDTLTFSYQVQITGLNVGETLCNQVTASSEEYQLSSDGPGCQACVSREAPPSVPAFTGLGLLAMVGLISASGLVLHRRRRRMV